MGESVAHAVRTERPGDAPSEEVEVAVEHEDDQDNDMTSHMQLPPEWGFLLQSFQADLELRDRGSQAGIAEWMVDWLGHRCCNEREGYFVGHVQG